MAQELIIPGWPDPSEEEIRQFQENNGIDVDGISGPQTLGACWREPGEPITFLSPYSVRDGGASASEQFSAVQLERMSNLPLRAEDMHRLIGICFSSEWETGFDFLSTQDGITYGCRRLAASTFARFVKTYEDLFRRYLGVYHLRQLKRHVDRRTNGYPLNVPAIRAGMLEACKSGLLWCAQLEEMVLETRQLLDRHKWAKRGRSIALLIRVHNSRSAWTRKIPRGRGEGGKYAALRRKYHDDHDRGPDRIRVIERAIGLDEKWRD